MLQRQRVCNGEATDTVGLRIAVMVTPFSAAIAPCPSAFPAAAADAAAADAAAECPAQVHPEQWPAPH